MDQPNRPISMLMLDRCAIGRYCWTSSAVVFVGVAALFKLRPIASPGVPAALAVCSLAAAIHERRSWRGPTRLLRQQFARAKAAEMTLEEMAELTARFPPELREIAKDVQQAARELREARLALAVMEKEMRDRIANRTEALERKLTSTRIQASKDSLTGLYNRRMLEQTLPEMLDKCRAERKDFTVLAMDVDRFKPLNDTLGHAAGDEFLRSIGQILRSGVRNHDVPVRTGGDEFLILLPGCEMAAARALGDRLAAMVDGLSRTLRMANPPALSIGAASMRDLPGCASSQDLLAAADKDLYAVKTSRPRAT